MDGLLFKNYKKPAFWTIMIAILVCLITGMIFLINSVRVKRYSDEELVSMAAEYFIMNNGRDYLYLPEQIEVSTLEEEGQVVLSLYDVINDGEKDGHGVTWAVYQVDRKTAAGYEMRSFDAVDLTKIKASHNFHYDIIEDQEGVWQLDMDNLANIKTNSEMEKNEKNMVDAADENQAKVNVIERFHGVEWDELEAGKLKFTGEIYANSTEIQCIGEIPEYQIKLYGYGDDDYQGIGVAVQIGEDVNIFDWTYASPRELPPSVYWNEKDKILQTSLKIYTGTGVAAEELHILRQYDTGTLDDSIFTLDDYSLLLQQMIGFQYLEKEKRLKLILLSDQSILTEIENIDEPNGVDSLELGLISSFILGDDISIQVESGYIPNGQITAEYEGMPTLIFPVKVKVDDSNNTLFQLDDPHVIHFKNES